ncbi:unnamed protein product [Cylicocyclus nassatus]|uniref:Decapping nuclease n=1 Tax=Cylicocyclus nassatus TaxID=53992 RepID=A0AA36GNF4_CYLNA|nr:unnamed protein product [Cylicocyclus nassatus]
MFCCLNLQNLENQSGLVSSDRQLVPKGARYLDTDALRDIVDNKNLYEGFETFKNKPEERQNMFWDWITTKAPTRSQLKEKLNGADFVCGRGLLKRVANAPYTYAHRKSKDNYWRISAKRVGDVIFLCESERYRNHKLPQNEQREVYRGFSFGEYVTETRRDVTLATDEPATNIDEFVAVMQSTLALSSKSQKPLNLLYNGEIDALYKENGVPVELKVTKVSHLLTNLSRKGDKLSRTQWEWFLHSYFMGITDIYVCYDNEEGVVKEVEKKSVKDLFEASKVNVCMNVLYKVLNEIKSILESDGDVCVVEHLKGSVEAKICRVASTNFFSPKFKEQFGVD